MMVDTMNLSMAITWYHLKKNNQTCHQQMWHFKLATDLKSLKSSPLMDVYYIPQVNNMAD